jgi:Ser/Thr protein kinase RdoA (MazF antagonist)
MGIDGKYLPEFFLTPRDHDSDTKFSPEKLMQSCEALGMGYTKLSLYHLDLGPGNILLDVDTKMMSVIDFECVGYVPDGWITTEFKVCSGFRLKLL